MEFFGSVLWLLLMLLGAGILALYVYQKWMVYVPYFPGDGANSFERPEDHGIIPELVSNATFKALDGVHLHGYFVRHPKSLEPGAKLPVIYYLHENAGNLSHRFPNIKAFIDRLDCHVFILSYRGYGNSSGTPSEAGLLLDAMAGLRWLHTARIGIPMDLDNIFIFGRSLGGAVALSLAAELNLTEPSMKVKALILENTFVSVPSLVGHLMPLVSSVSAMVTNPFNSLEKAKEINPALPVLFISGGMDELVPPPMMRSLFDACVSKSKKFVVFVEGTHMETWQATGYWASVIQFISRT
jgi:fermentation-respiration switch protein FrsA (DUF1100 family)